MENLYKKIIELRKNSNLSQLDLADKLEVSRQAISKWERGETFPDLYNIKKLAIIFNISLDELLENKVSNKQIEKVNHSSNKLARILYGIPGIILLLFSINGFLGASTSSIVAFVGLLSGEHFEYSINTTALMSLPTLIPLVLLTKTLMSIFTGKKLSSTKPIAIFTSIIFVISFLSILLYVNLQGFSMIFLYIIALLTLITMLVGALLIDITLDYDDFPKIHSIYKRILKPSMIFIIAIIIIGGISFVGHKTLFVKVEYVDDFDLQAASLVSEPGSTLLIDANRPSRDSTDYNSFNITYIFTAILEDMIIDNNLVNLKIYIGDEIFLDETDIIIVNNQLTYTLETSKEFEVDLNEGDLTFFKGIEDVYYILTYKINDIEITKTYLMLPETFGSSGSSTYIYIWEYNKMK